MNTQLCENCNAENAIDLKECTNCGNTLNVSSNAEYSFFTPKVKFQLILAVVVFLIAFFGTKYLISEYKNSTKIEAESSNNTDQGKNLE